MKIYFVLILVFMIFSYPIITALCHDDFEEELKWENVLYQLELRYDRIIIVDTVLTIINQNDPKVAKIHYEFYCLKDSAINLPQEYIWSSDKTLKKFVTHNFAVKLKIQSTTTNIDTILKKDDFAILNKFDPDLMKYGTIQDFYLLDTKNKNFKKNIIFYFSFSIPMTDVGIGIFLRIKGNKLIFSTTQE